jgi:hypothetical protein
LPNLNLDEEWTSFDNSFFNAETKRPGVVSSIAIFVFKSACHNLANGFAHARLQTLFEKLSTVCIPCSILDIKSIQM